MLDDVDIEWTARLARTCRCCGCKAVEIGRCTVCGAVKAFEGQPWMVARVEARTSVIVATPAPAAPVTMVLADPAPSTAQPAWIAPRSLVVTGDHAPTVATTATPTRPNVTKMRTPKKQAPPTPKQGSLF